MMAVSIITHRVPSAGVTHLRKERFGLSLSSPREASNVICHGAGQRQEPQENGERRYTAAAAAVKKKRTQDLRAFVGDAPLSRTCAQGSLCGAPPL
mmetsp:Transcript_6927/g.13829  ORF Transcript_6927/g.13829 Transcript_6927/m.13829 type:complete len:96 (-) Transcript_6927:189-476(-)